MNSLEKKEFDKMRDDLQESRLEILKRGQFIFGWFGIRFAYRVWCKYFYAK